MPTAHRAPAHLDTRGRAFWRVVTTDYALRPDELRVLEDACRELDLIDRMEAAQRDTPLTVPGSHEQPVAAPLLGELRAHRGLLARLLNQLRLPDEDGGRARGGPGSGTGSATTSTQARAAAAARWRRGGVS